MRNRVVCLDCGRKRTHCARGLCGPCWRRHNNNGTLGYWPPIGRGRKAKPKKPRKPKKRGRALNPDTPANRAWRNIKSRSGRRHHKLGITFEQFKEMSQEPCFYCGVGPSNTCIVEGHSPWYYNGLDRVDSDQGYIEGNVVPCCKACNLAKLNMSFDDFMSWLDGLARFQGYTR